MPRAIGRALAIEDPRALYAEFAILAALCTAAIFFALHQFYQFEFERLCRGFDIWFDSDPGRTVAGVTDRYAPYHERSRLHPLWSMLIAAPVRLISRVAGLNIKDSIALYVALQAACLTSTIYIAQRTFGFRRIDAVLGTVLCFSTAGFIYWIGFPEWLAFGAASILVSVIWFAAPPGAQNHATGVAQSVISASITASHWAIGIAASLLYRWPRIEWAQAYRHTRDALALLALLTVFQYLLFPTAGGFFKIWSDATLQRNRVETPIVNHTITFFAHTLAAPTPIVVEGARKEPGFVRIITNQMAPADLTPLSILVFGLWIVLAAIGIRAALASRRDTIVIGFVGFVLALFYVLHSVYGGHTFLFSLQFVPLMAFIALWGSKSDWRWVVRGLCAVLIVASFAFSYPQFQATVAIHNATDLSWLDGMGYASDYNRTLQCL